MPRPRIDAVAVTARNMEESLRFYRCLGFEFPPFEPDEQHIEAVAQNGEARLMIDAASLAQDLTGRPAKPASHSAFAMLCETPAEVDEIAERVKSAGFDLATEPWDAFWGQRYATARDPDGYEIDLFAPLNRAAQT